jgi:CheY-like chemotaxis protein
MPKVLLLTFDVESRQSRRQDLEEAGFSVAVEEPSWPAALEAAKRFEPDVIAVDCGQLPSHGRETAAALRTTPPADAVPLVLFRVADHDVERTRLKVPGGVVAFDWELLDRLRSAALTRLAQLAAMEEEESSPGQHGAPDPAPAAESGGIPPSRSSTKKSAARRKH